MLCNLAGTDSTVAATVASITRMTSWQLIDELPLRFDSHHPQGMARVGSTWWISTVDVDARRGLVMGVDSRGNLVEQVAAVRLYASLGSVERAKAVGSLVN